MNNCNSNCCKGVIIVWCYSQFPFIAIHKIFLALLLRWVLVKILKTLDSQVVCLQPHSMWHRQDSNSGIWPQTELRTIVFAAGHGWVDGAYKGIPSRETIEAKVRILTLFLCGFHGQ